MKWLQSRVNRHRIAAFFVRDPDFQFSNILSQISEKTRFKEVEWQLIVQIIVIITQIYHSLLNEHICCHIMSRKSLSSRTISL